MKNKAMCLYMYGFVSLLFSLEALAQPRRDVGVADGRTAVRPLQVGDTIPGELWNRSLTVLHHNNAHTALSLKDYRHAVVVLDFWRTWCSVCIREFPKLFELKRQFDPHDVLVLPIVMQSKDMVTSAMERTTIHTIPDFATALDDGYLSRRFPASGYPHVVVLHDGKVAAITKPEYLDKDRLADLSKGKSIYMPAEIDQQEAGRQPLLAPVYTGLRQYKPVYYSALMGFQDGLASAPFYESKEAYTRLMIPNVDLWTMYEHAYGYQEDQRVFEISAFPNRRVILLDDPAHYFDWRPISRYAKDERSNIKKTYYYTYDAYMPPSVDKRQARLRLAKSLDSYLHICTSVETLSVGCLVLGTYDGIDNVKCVGDVRSTGRRVARYLNHPSFRLPPVICDDELTDHDMDRLALEEKSYGLSELNELLRPRGLVLRPETRMLDMFVVRKADNMGSTFDLSELRLGRYGFAKGGDR